MNVSNLFAPVPLWGCSIKRLITFKKKQEWTHHYKCCSSKSIYPERIFSGIQPTGSLHLGNHFGAVQKWIELQHREGSAIFSIVDLHSITLPQEPKILQKNVIKVAATLLACGIDPAKSVLFQQSKVSQHAELCWVLGCITTMPRLAHLPQFKEKSSSLKDVPLGLYVYPVLQAADILLYKTTHVPVGEDQLQHLQLAQHLARGFNNRFGNLFPVPKSIVGDSSTSRLRSLRDPSKKMSKSDIDPKSRIELDDQPEVILDKCKKALTDFQSELTFDREQRPGVANLITIHSLFSGLQPDEICNKYSDIDTGRYKVILAEVIQESLKPVRERINNLLAEPKYVGSILDDGARRAQNIAEETWQEVKERVGLVYS